MIVDAGLRLAVAGLIGLAIGLEREWSGHASGPDARFAGVRTFLILGLIGGLAGWTIGEGLAGVGVPLLAGAVLLVVAAYATAVQRSGSTDGTTEVAAVAVLGLGAVAGVGHLAVASAVTAVMALALREKERIRALLPRVAEPEIRAAFQFAVLALVILPILPAGPYGPFGGIQPRTLWIVVLLISGLNFAGYIARRAVGASRGFAIAGALGGLASSTAVTLSFAQRSRVEPVHGAALGLGVVAACTVLVPRVLVVSWALSPVLGRALAPALLLPMVVGAGIVLLLRRRRPEEADEADDPPLGNPLQLGAAIRMAVLFQAMLLGLEFASDRFGERGLLATSAFLGLTDMDALTFSVSRMAGTTVEAGMAAQAVLIGLISNTLFKLGVGVAVGRGPFLKVVAAGLLVLAMATLAGLWLVFT